MRHYRGRDSALAQCLGMIASLNSRRHLGGGLHHARLPRVGCYFQWVRRSPVRCTSLIMGILDVLANSFGSWQRTDTGRPRVACPLELVANTGSYDD
jgi:hypothetical protein